MRNPFLSEEDLHFAASSPAFTISEKVPVNQTSEAKIEVYSFNEVIIVTYFALRIPFNGFGREVTFDVLAKESIEPIYGNTVYLDQPHACSFSGKFFLFKKTLFVPQSVVK